MSEKKTLIEKIEENKKILRAEYQRGFANGGKDMNEKWLITSQELISEFVEWIEYILNSFEGEIPREELEVEIKILKEKLK